MAGVPCPVIIVARMSCNVGSVCTGPLTAIRSTAAALREVIEQPDHQSLLVAQSAAELSQGRSVADIADISVPLFACAESRKLVPEGTALQYKLAEKRLQNGDDKSDTETSERSPAAPALALPGSPVAVTLVSECGKEMDDPIVGAPPLQ